MGVKIKNEIPRDRLGSARDTGAIYTVVCRTLLESIGLKPVEKRRFRAFGARWRGTSASRRWNSWVGEEA